jgi:hypothetical protein
MEITGKVHCFFEQSGTFKNEFIKLGIPAEDYDIQNNFGETDHVVDLFKEIEDAYDDKQSIFDNISKDDLIVAFFPCIYFTGFTNPRYFTLENNNYKMLNLGEKLDKIIERANNRQTFYLLLIKMVGVCLKRGFRLIFENPYSTEHFLHNNFFKEPSVIDKNRMMRGDYFVKPTGYWYFNCEPTFGFSYQNDKEKKTIIKSKSASRAGLCSEDRSLISHDYARNFICDFILGKEQKNTQLKLF